MSFLVSEINKEILSSEDMLVSFDVVSLNTKILIMEAIDTIRSLLMKPQVSEINKEKPSSEDMLVSFDIVSL